MTSMLSPFGITTLADEYRQQGFVVCRGVFAAEEINELATEADDLLKRTDLIDMQNLRCRWQKHVDGSDCVFETFDPVIDLGPVSRRIAYDSRILDILAQLYGEPARLFKDKLIFKPPGAFGYDLHQDYIAFPDFPRSFLTVLVPIDAADLKNGCTIVYPGYHQQGCMSAEDGDYHALGNDSVDHNRAVPLELLPGDIAVFTGFTPHRSAPNHSTGYRRQLYLSYNATSDGGDFREPHYRIFLEWLEKKYAEYGKTGVYYR